MNTHLLNRHRYRGLFDLQNWYSVVVEEDVGDGERRISELPLRLDLHDRSPSGLAWGYGGAGPGQLCCALLAHVLGVPERIHILSWAERQRVLEQREAQGEDRDVASDELAEQEYEKRRRARARRRFLEDVAELLEGSELLELRGRRLVFDLAGPLDEDIVGRLPHAAPWVIEARDLLEWVHAPKDQRHAIGERIVRAAVRAGKLMKLRHGPPAGPSLGAPG